jgi:hypothetical protein
MNPTNLAMSVSLVVGFASAQSAQTTSSDYGKVDQRTRQNITVRVTGCVVDGITAGRYILTDAIISTDDVSSIEGAAGTLGAEKDVSIEHGPSYDLEGGNLKAHVGHKIEVTGFPGDAKLNSRDTLALAAGSVTLEKATLTVRSVKMISAICP